MCEPTTIALATLAITTAAAASSYQQGRQSAKAQNEYSRQNAENATQATLNAYTQQQTRMVQESDAASAQRSDIAIQAMQDRATARVAAGEAGVSGLSVDALISDMAGREARAVDRVDQNRDMNLQQLNADMQGFRSQGTDRVNSVRTAAGPSVIDLGLKIGAGAVSAYDDYKYPATRYTRGRTK